MDKKLEDRIREFLGIPDILCCNEPENSYGYWYDFAVNLHRAAQTANHEWMEEIIYPKIELIFNKHDGEALTYTLLDTIKQELDRLREQVIESTSNDHMAKFVFDDCIIQKLISLFQDPYYFRMVKSHLYYFRMVKSHLLGEYVQNEESDDEEPEDYMHRKRRETTSMMRWHFCKNGDLPNVERPTDEDPLVHSMEKCLVSYHFTTASCSKHRDVFIFRAFREGEPEWRHNDQWCSPIAESIIVDAWISLDEIYDHLWKQENE